MTGESDKGVRPTRYMAKKVYGYLKPFFAWCAKPGINKLSISPMPGIDMPWGGAKPRERVYDDDELKRLWAAAEKLGGLE